MPPKVNQPTTAENQSATSGLSAFKGTPLHAPRLPDEHLPDKFGEAKVFEPIPPEPKPESLFKPASVQLQPPPPQAPPNAAQSSSNSTLSTQSVFASSADTSSLEASPNEAPTLSAAPAAEPPPIVSPKPSFLSLLRLGPIRLISGLILIIGLSIALLGLFNRSADPSQVSSQDSTSNLFNPTEGKIVLNLDTSVQGKLAVTSDVQTAAGLIASGGNTSLSQSGLKINNVTVCTATGCTPNGVAAGARGAIGATGPAGPKGDTGDALCAAGCIVLQSTLPPIPQTGNLSVSGIVLAGNLQGDGSGITNLTASSFSSGTLADARLSANVALLDRNSQTFTGSNLFKNAANSTTAFQIQNAAGSSNLLIADTANSMIGIGATPANGLLTIGTNTNLATGGIYFGTDVNLYRVAANTLGTDDRITSARQANGDIWFQGSIAGQAQEQFKITSSSGGPILSFGNGSSGTDVNLYRSGADTLTTDDRFTITRQANNDIFLQGSIASQPQEQYKLASSATGPVLSFGDGTAGLDTNLYRSAANTLKTDDNFVVAGALLDLQHANAELQANNLGAASQAWLKSRLSGDTNNRFVVQANGKIEWGPGNTAADTNLYRLTADLLATDDRFLIHAGALTNAGLSIKETSADANDRFRVLGNGTVQFGDGTAVQDTNLYRSAADTLKTDDSFHIGSAFQVLLGLARTDTNQTLRFILSGSGTILQSFLSGDANFRFTSSDAGLLQWGDGTAAQDTNLYRSAANSLKTDDNFYVGSSVAITVGNRVDLTDIPLRTTWSSSNTAYQSMRSGDANFRYSMSDTGLLQWGDGTAVQDTNLYRNSANFLRTDDTFGSALDIYARHGVAGQVVLGAVGPSSEAAIKFGSTEDTNLYRSAPDTLKTDDNFVAGSSLTVTGTGLFQATSTTAFRLQNSGGTTTVLTADTSGDQLTLTNARARDSLSVNVSANNTLTTADNNAADRGSYASIGMGLDGMPRISYYDATNGDLRYVQCTSITCNTTSANALDVTNNVGQYTAVAIRPSDGFARIAHYDATNGAVRWTTCGTDNCGSGSNFEIDTTNDRGQGLSMALGSDEFGRIAYYDATAGDLIFAQCVNNNCSSPTITSIDTTGDVGQYTSIAMGSDGFARIAYYDGTNADLKFAQCTNAACSTSTLTTVDTAGDRGKFTSIAMGSDGFARISYYDVTNGDLEFVQCTNAACSTNVKTEIDATGDVGQYTSIKMSPIDGFARIAYRDVTNADLKFVRCTNAACSTSVISTIDSVGSVGSYASLVLGFDGYARIAYYDASSNSGDLKVALMRGDTSSVSGTDVGASATNFANVYSGKVQAKYFNLQPSTDSTTTFQISNAAGSQLLVADTSNGYIYIGSNTADSTAILLILDIKTTAGDPNCVNGGLYYNSNSSTIRGCLNSAWDDLVPAAGWVGAGETWTYASADDPTFTFTISGDKTGKYTSGMRIKLTQTTAKYFIITNVAYSAPNTTMTIFGGTDYDLANAAISAPFYSAMKAPQGLPLDPAKWTVTINDTGSQQQASPTTGTWYNLGSLSISIPIGLWNVEYETCLQVTSTGQNDANADMALSTSSSSASDNDFIASMAVNAGSTNSVNLKQNMYRRKIVSLSSKTTHYLVAKAVAAASDITFRGDRSPTIIRAVSAYL